MRYDIGQRPTTHKHNTQAHFDRKMKPKSENTHNRTNITLIFVSCNISTYPQKFYKVFLLQHMCNPTVTFVTDCLLKCAFLKKSFLLPTHANLLMKTKFITSFTIAVLASQLQLVAKDDLNDTRDVLDKWVETRQIISEEQANWHTEKSILGDTLGLLSSELERLDAALKELETSATAADEDRSKLTEEKEALNAASTVVTDHLSTLETAMKQIVTKLPDPLVSKIKPLIRRLPEDPKNTKLSLGERVQNIVGILSQTDKFNTTVTLTSESREIDSGKMIEVRTLYWGLAMAYYVDASGTYAGIGYPGASGWEWPKVEGAGPEIKRLLDVYEGSEEIQFVNVPAQIN